MKLQTSQRYVSSSSDTSSISLTRSDQTCSTQPHASRDRRAAGGVRRGRGGGGAGHGARVLRGPQPGRRGAGELRAPPPGHARGRGRGAARHVAPQPRPSLYQRVGVSTQPQSVELSTTFREGPLTALLHSPCLSPAILPPPQVPGARADRHRGAGRRRAELPQEGGGRDRGLASRGHRGHQDHLRAAGVCQGWREWI